MTQHATALVWFRSDLRVDDNSALSAAMANHARVTAVYCATPGQWRHHGLSPNRVDFIRRNLACLAGELQQLRVPLELIVVEDFSALPAQLQGLSARLGVSAVYANREYGVDELARDDQVCAALAARDIAWHCFDDSPVLTPGSVRTQGGEPFKVFTPFKRRWLQLLANRPFACERTPRPQAGAIPVLSTFAGWRYPEATIDTAQWPAGEAAAHQRLQDFVENGLAGYKAQRDLPALDATSRLSPYLSLGVISVRRCLRS
ncbi:MAG TPA: deoxyribodipyrimidine photo-lyase, partial [Spongiibacteraceae bacterium]|nr:deoxyribodipyrimidine photo-lyase [Spongiibacteraceae bacterium]